MESNAELLSRRAKASTAAAQAFRAGDSASYEASRRVVESIDQQLGLAPKKLRREASGYELEAFGW